MALLARLTVGIKVQPTGTRVRVFKSTGAEIKTA